MSNDVDQKKLELQQIGIVERPDMNGLVLRVKIYCDMNLPSADALIGELITWRDRLATMRNNNQS